MSWYAFQDSTGVSAETIRGDLRRGSVSTVGGREIPPLSLHIISNGVTLQGPT
jgi:hypothetical protein